MHELACLLVSCLLLAHNNCLLQTVRAADECRSLYASGKDTRIIWAHKGNIQGESVHRVTSCFPHVSSKIPSPSPAHQTHPQFSKDCSFNVWDPKKCVRGLLEKCIWGPKKCVGGLKKWVWGLPKKCGCRGLKTRFQEMGVRSPPRNVYEVPRNVCKRSQEMCMRSQEICARSQEKWEVPRNVCKVSRNVG
jgi:hypothetical protein